MRITYRYANNKNYWTERWANIPVDSSMENANKYPLKYSEMMINNDKSGKILEAGCGAGRILKYYHNRGFSITGFDFIPEVIEKLKINDPSLNVEVGDITNLNYESGSYKYVFAFGLYHNLNMPMIKKAILETKRILEKNGEVCASFRADNIQNRINDFLANRKSLKNKNDGKKQFHKMNLKQKEFAKLFSDEGFEIKKIIPVENMPLLYKFKFFRAKAHKEFNEKLGRRDGYLLSPIGSLIQKTLITFFPSQFCNINIIIAKKS